MKKIIALSLAFIMIFALAACTGTQSGGVADTDPLTKDDVISLLIPSSASWPINEDMKLFEYMAEGSGATLDVTPIPATDAVTKYPLLFAAREELPDIIAFQVVKEALPYAGAGLVALDDMAEYMPNYNAWLDSLSEDQYAVSVNNRIASDGKVYYTPGTGREGTARMYAWLYREDVFKKHGLTVPTTYDELYEVCKKLKDIYPDSYPLCLRQGFSFINATGSSFDKWWETTEYYDFDDEEWRWGATEDTALEAITFYKKMVAEDLMPSNFGTMNATEWDELILTDRGFIFPTFQTRIDYFNQAAAANNPEFKLQAFAPPVANAENGMSMVTRGDIEMIGLSIPDTGKADKMANAAKFIDWMYTDEAMELLSWGKEGETYEVVNGKKQFITDDKGSAPNALYGFTLYGSFTRLDPESVYATQSETLAETRELVASHTLPYHNPEMYLDFNDEEQKTIDIYNTACITYTDEMLTKFVLGQEPLSNFDVFVKTLEEMGVNEVLGAYESAYARIK